MQRIFYNHSSSDMILQAYTYTRLSQYFFVNAKEKMYMTGVSVCWKGQNESTNIFVVFNDVSIRQRYGTFNVPTSYQ